MMELKFVAGTGIFEGYASVFHVTDSANDIILPGAFKASIAVFEKAGKFPPLLWQHDVKSPIGAWREMREDEHGLFVRGELFTETSELAKEAQKLMEEKVVTGLSIGYRVKKSHKDEKTGARVLEEIALLEISMVTFPANEHARIIAPGDELPTEKSLETLLRGAGLSRRQAKGILSCGYRALRDEGDDADFFNGLASYYEERAAQVYAEVKFSPSQPRVPAGNSGGGQWTATGAGAGSSKPVFVPREKPKPIPPGSMTQMPRSGRSDSILKDPARDAIKPVYPIESLLASVYGGRALNLAISILDRFPSTQGQAYNRERQTDHGDLRYGERNVKDSDIDTAIESAKKSGNVTIKNGPYNTPQNHYHGDNGLTVIVETQGRNAGKIITMYGKLSGGKLR